MKIKLLFLLLCSTCAFSQLTLQTPAPLSVCDDNNDGFIVFDLTEKDFEITASLPAGQYGVAYLETMADAQNDVNAIFYTQFYTNIQASIQTLFVRVTDFNNPVNIGFTTLTIRVLPVPMAMQPNDYQLCDGPENDGFATFDLSTVDAGILTNGVDDVEYFETMSDAMAGVNAVPNIYINIASSVQTMYGRVTNGSGCYIILTFDLRVNARPPIVTPPDMIVYENPTDGSASFDLTQQTPIIISEFPFLNVTYYESEADAIAGTSPIFSPESYLMIANPSLIWAAGENTATGCRSYTSFQLIVTDQLGVQSHDSAANVSLYPNPVDGMLNFTSSGDISGINVFDVGGRLISTQIANGSAATFDFQPYASGIYFVKVTTPTGTQTRKIVRK
jgi:hypothetical protein